MGECARGCQCQGSTKLIDLGGQAPGRHLLSEWLHSYCDNTGRAQLGLCRVQLINLCIYTLPCQETVVMSGNLGG